MVWLVTCFVENYLGIGGFSAEVLLSNTLSNTFLTKITDGTGGKESHFKETFTVWSPLTEQVFIRGCSFQARFGGWSCATVNRELHTKGIDVNIFNLS